MPVMHFEKPLPATSCLFQLISRKTARIAQASSVLLADPCFQLHSIQHLLGRGEASAGADDKHFSLHSSNSSPISTDTDYITAEEAQKVEKMLTFLTEESKQAAATTASIRKAFSEFL
ncbi:E3 ubiquitin-protein ligase RNF123 isoform X2 [Silurus meridionalis]|nr:E3 ubiquitin-protein ligase RNF123 isoform X2 [Silurus meridionalis]